MWLKVIDDYLHRRDSCLKSGSTTVKKYVVPLPLSTTVSLVRSIVQIDDRLWRVDEAVKLSYFTSTSYQYLDSYVYPTYTIKGDVSCRRFPPGSFTSFVCTYMCACVCVSSLFRGGSPSGPFRCKSLVIRLSIHRTVDPPRNVSVLTLTRSLSGTDDPRDELSVCWSTESVCDWWLWRTSLRDRVGRGSSREKSRRVPTNRFPIYGQRYTLPIFKLKGPPSSSKY